MKKFLATFLLALAIAIPATFAEAADVPDFYQIGGRNLTFTGKEIGKNKPMRVYGYDCSVDLNENFAEQFMNNLSNFRLIGHYVNDYRRGQAKIWERWIFVYTGSKSPATFEHKNVKDRKNPYYCQLVVSRSKDWNTEITHFAVYVANGLTYGGD